jgi:hypothetical protein
MVLENALCLLQIEEAFIAEMYRELARSLDVEVL